MAKLIGFLFLLIATAEAHELHVVFKKIWTLPSSYKINKNKVGGLSGCSVHDSKIYFVSDDRGSHGGPRIVIFNYDANRQEIDFKNAETIFVKPDKNKFLDLEGIGVLNPERILLSSEGDYNQRPRNEPEIFWIDHSGKKIKSILFPTEFLPEKTGRQKKGIQNNLAFEGLSFNADSTRWAALLEAPLLQTPNELKLIESAIDSNQFDHIYSYPVPQAYFSKNESEKPVLAYFGPSDLLYLTAESFLVLERGVSLSTQGVGFRSQLCQVQKIDEKVLSRSCFYSMNEDEKLKVEIPNGANFEGLCWVNKQKKIFLTVSDNNFSKNEKTVFILYQLN